MANRTDPTARSIRGTNPQNLLEKIVREKIYQTTYWKEQCLGLTAETLVYKAMRLFFVGSTFTAARKPTPFLCLLEKMLQIQPEKEIVVEFIKNEDNRYVRILGAFYLRLTGTDTDVYLYLEPLYNDNRKLVMLKQDGELVLSHVDEFVDNLLTMDYCCGIALPRIKKRDRRDEDYGRDGEREGGIDRERLVRESDRKKERMGRTDHSYADIAEINKLRVQLGLKPLGVREEPFEAIESLRRLLLKPFECLRRTLLKPLRLLLKPFECLRRTLLKPLRV